MAFVYSEKQFMIVCNEDYIYLISYLDIFTEIYVPPQPKQRDNLSDYSVIIFPFQYTVCPINYAQDFVVFFLYH